MIHYNEFEEVPLTIKDFIFSPHHLNFVTISPRQLRLMEYICGYDVTKVFDNNRNLAIVVWGKGSGKDTCIASLFCYFVYYLLCLECPAKSLGLQETDWIDIINVAASREQATHVFFEMLKNKLQNWPWLRQKYKLIISYSGTSSAKEGTVLIQKNLITFPKNIRLLSGHTNLASLEGRNVLVFVLDEADGMRTEKGDVAEQLYRLLRTSAVSRFGQRHKGFIITYPRSKDSFSITMFKKYADDLSVYTDIAPTWEVKPPSCFSGKFFRFREYLVPIEFKEDFDKDPYGATTCYMCIPMEVESPFIEIPSKVDEAATSVPIVLTEDYVDGSQVKKRITGWTRQCDRPHVIGVDLGLRIDSACISVVHVELREKGKIYVQDLLLSWEPDYSKDETVSFKNVAEIILELSKKLKIAGVVFDRWNSAMMIEELRNYNIPCFEVTLTTQDYFFLKEQLYSGKINLVPDPIFIEELKRMVILKGKKVDHLPKYSKDRVDSLCCALRLLKDLDPISNVSDWVSFDSRGADFMPAENAGFKVISKL